MLAAMILSFSAAKVETVMAPMPTAFRRCGWLFALAVLVAIWGPQAAAAGSPAPSSSDGTAALSASHPNSSGGSASDSGAAQDGARPRRPEPPAADPLIPPGKAGHEGAGGAATDGVAPARYRAGRETPASQLLDWLGPLHDMTPGERELSLTTDNSFLDPINWNVTVLKSRHQLVVYYKGRTFKAYHAVFGFHSDGAKRWEGDLRTPEGVYTIIGKYNHPRWKHFLRLNYPNYVDRRNYDAMLHDGVVPVIHGQRRALGSAIGIHGTDRPRFNRDDINWTRGCISVDNDAISELDHLLPIDTLVIIKP